MFLLTSHSLFGVGLCNHIRIAFFVMFEEVSATTFLVKCAMVGLFQFPDNEEEGYCLCAGSGQQQRKVVHLIMA